MKKNFIFIHLLFAMVVMSSCSKKCPTDYFSSKELVFVEAFSPCYIYKKPNLNSDRLYYEFQGEGGLSYEWFRRMPPYKGYGDYQIVIFEKKEGALLLEECDRFYKISYGKEIGYVPKNHTSIAELEPIDISKISSVATIKSGPYKNMLIYPHYSYAEGPYKEISLGFIYRGMAIFFISSPYLPDNEHIVSALFNEEDWTVTPEGINSLSRKEQKELIKHIYSQGDEEFMMIYKSKVNEQEWTRVSKEILESHFKEQSSTSTEIKEEYKTIEEVMYQQHGDYSVFESDASNMLNEKVWVVFLRDEEMAVFIQSKNIHKNIEIMLRYNYEIRDNRLRFYNGYEVYGWTQKEKHYPETSAEIFLNGENDVSFVNMKKFGNRRDLHISATLTDETLPNQFLEFIEKYARR